MKVKAIFLLFIFHLNTAIGLNCALHKDVDCCAEVAEYHDANLSSYIINHSLTSIDKKDSCCQGIVNNFSSLAKLVPQTLKVDIQLPIALTTSYHHYDLTTLPDVQLKIQNFVVKRQRPPTLDTRIIIQSFQI